jgi:uncharacterized phiE125 gp8 family phage protein
MNSDLPFRLHPALAPAVEPVTLAEALAHTRVDDSADNSLVQALIVAARRAAEAYTRRAFISQSWAMYLDQAPAGNFLEIPKAPLIGISSIQTFTDADVATTFASSNYYVDLITKPGRVVLRTAASWPTPTRAASGFVVNFRAGYGATGSHVPADIRQAILMIVSHLYENRGDAESDMPRVAQMLLEPYKDWAF